VTTERNKQIVLKLLDAFEHLDIDSMDALLATDVMWEIPGDPLQFPLAGPLSRNDLLARLPVVFPYGIRMTATGVTAEGDRVGVEVESEGVMGDGYVYRNRYHFLFAVRDDRVVLAREYCDTQTAAGLLAHMTPPSK
jgi:ketosteroid isomerase-like protein